MAGASTGSRVRGASERHGAAGETCRRGRGAVAGEDVGTGKIVLTDKPLDIILYLTVALAAIG